MLKECIEILNNEIENSKGKFEDQSDKYDKQIEFITDNYTLDPGRYVLIDVETESIKYIDIKIKENRSINYNLYDKFAKLDYLSKVRYYNKTLLSPNKIISSNNYLSFFIKIDNINKLEKEIIDNYFSFLKNPNYKDYDKKIYNDFINKYGITNENKILKCKNIIEKIFFDNGSKLHTILENLPKGGTQFLKIFIQINRDDNKNYLEYKIESLKYLYPKLYNKTKEKYITEIQKNNNIILLGIPDINENSTFNDNKPFNENLSRKNKLPLLFTLDKLIDVKILFDYLLNSQNEEKATNYLYFSPKKQKIFKKLEDINTGYVLTVVKKNNNLGTFSAILDFDTITNYSSEIELEIKDYLNIDYNGKSQNLEYKTLHKLNELEKDVDSILYNKKLIYNYTNEPKKIKNLGSKEKEILIRTRNYWCSLFYKGNNSMIKANFKKFGFELIKSTFIDQPENFFLTSVKEKFNLYKSICNYFSEDENMFENLQKTVNDLDEKINTTETKQIESDDEFYFAIGQLVYFFIYKDQSSSKKHSLINPILNTVKPELVLKELTKMFEHYNHAIGIYDLKFNNLYSMILAYPYTKNSKVNINNLLCGYLHSSLLLKAANKEN